MTTDWDNWYRSRRSVIWHSRRDCVSLKNVPAKDIRECFGDAPGWDARDYCANCVRYNPHAKL